MKNRIAKNCRAGKLYQRFMPILVWLSVVACIAVLFRHRTERYEFVGLAQGEVRQIAATITGRLKNVPVQLFEEVTQGQTLAVLDTVLENENLHAQLATAKAQIGHLHADLNATQDRLTVQNADRQTDLITDHRRFVIDVERSRLQVLELSTVLEPDRIMLRNLQAEIDLEEKLKEKYADTKDYALTKAQVNYEALAKKIEATENELAQARKVIEEAESRLEEFAQRQPVNLPVDSELEVIREAINVQKMLIEELLVKSVPLKLKSPFDGMVSQILRRTGETVLPGEPILIIAQAEATEVIAYVGKDRVHQIREGADVELIKNSQPPQIVSSQVAYLGPKVELMPERLWMNPSVPQWGRPLLVPVPQKTKPFLKLIPGEVVGIREL